MQPPRPEHGLPTAAAGSSQAPTAAVDNPAVHRWAGGACDASTVPDLTSSIPAALALIRGRVAMFSWTLSVGSDGQRSTAWAELALQPIPRSYRLSVSSAERPLDLAAKALLMALLNAELGHAVGFGDWRPRSMMRGFSPWPAALRDSVLRRGPALFEACPFLSTALKSDGWRDAVVEADLAQRFDLPPEFGICDDEATIFSEVQLALDSLCGVRSYKPVGGPYSISVQIATDGRGRCEVARRVEGGRGWLVALSYAPGQSDCTRPALALLIAALKAEHGFFDGYKR